VCSSLHCTRTCHYFIHSSIHVQCNVYAGGNHLIDGWPNVLHCLLWLHTLRFLPEDMVRLEDFRDSSNPGHALPSLRTHAQAASKQQAHTKQTPTAVNFAISFLSSAVRSLWTSSQSSSAKLSSSSTHNDTYVRRALDCVRMSVNGQLFRNTQFYLIDPLAHLLHSLVLVSTYASHTLTTRKPPLAIAAFDPRLLTEEVCFDVYVHALLTFLVYK